MHGGQRHARTSVALKSSPLNSKGAAEKPPSFAEVRLRIFAVETFEPRLDAGELASLETVATVLGRASIDGLQCRGEKRDGAACVCNVFRQESPGQVVLK
jgi:hypothetical protein